MDIQRPDLEVITLRNKDGSVAISAPAIELDILLGKAQEGIDPADPHSRDVWLERYLSLIKNDYDGVPDDLTIQDAYILALACSETVFKLKKKALPSETPAKSTASTSANATQNSESN